MWCSNVHAPGQLNLAQCKAILTSVLQSHIFSSQWRAEYSKQMWRWRIVQAWLLSTTWEGGNKCKVARQADHAKHDVLFELQFENALTVLLKCASIPRLFIQHSHASGLTERLVEIESPTNRNVPGNSP